MLWNDASRIALGTGSIGLRPDREAGYRMLDAFLDLGGEVIDTAAIYSDWVPGEIGRSEAVIGEWLAMRGGRDRVKLVTKGAHPPIGDVHHSRLDPASIRHDVEMSLKRLGVERVDLYFFHRDDRSRPVAAILEPLTPYLDQGRLGAIGGSNWLPDRLAEAKRLLGDRFQATQVLGNVLCQLMNPLTDDTLTKLDNDALAEAKADDLTVMLFTSQAQGALTKLATGLPRDYDNATCRAAISRLAAIAADKAIEPNVLGLAFMLQLSPSIIPVVGPRTIDQLQQSLSARSAKLDAATMAEIAGIAGFAV